MAKRGAKARFGTLVCFRARWKKHWKRVLEVGTEELFGYDWGMLIRVRDLRCLDGDRPTGTIQLCHILDYLAALATRITRKKSSRPLWPDVVRTGAFAYESPEPRSIILHSLSFLLPSVRPPIPLESCLPSPCYAPKRVASRVHARHPRPAHSTLRYALPGHGLPAARRSRQGPPSTPGHQCSLRP